MEWDFNVKCTIQIQRTKDLYHAEASLRTSDLCWHLETCSNLFIWGSLPLVMTSSGGHQKTYGWQAGGSYPTWILSCYNWVWVSSGRSDHLGLSDSFLTGPLLPPSDSFLPALFVPPTPLSLSKTVSKQTPTRVTCGSCGIFALFSTRRREPWRLSCHRVPEHIDATGWLWVPCPARNTERSLSSRGPDKIYSPCHPPRLPVITRGLLCVNEWVEGVRM